MKNIITIIVFIVCSILLIVLIASAGGGRPQFGGTEILPPQADKKAYTASEEKLKDKIIEQKSDIISVNEWREQAPKFMDKMRFNAGMTEAEFLNRYYNQPYQKIIRGMNYEIHNE